MRSTLTVLLAAWLSGVSAQDAVTDDQVASVLERAPARSVVEKWSGAGRSFRSDDPLGPIEPIPLELTPWEFGDGSRSRILPPRPWSPADQVAATRDHMAPFRERHGGSPCVAMSRSWPQEPDPAEPRPALICESGLPVLVTTGLDAQGLRVRVVDPITGRGSSSERIYSSGRWALGAPAFSGPAFIILQDMRTGERWRAGIGL